MKIYKLWCDVDNYEGLIEEPFMSVDEWQSFDGRPKADGWKPIKVNRAHPKKMKLSDFPYAFTNVFSLKAVNGLKTLIEDDVEILPLEFEEIQYFVINVTTVLDVIDYDRSEFETFDNSDRILAFDKYAFRLCDDLHQHNIFKLIDEPASYTFVNERFKDEVERNGLTGFKFELVWDSEIISDLS